MSLAEVLDRCAHAEMMKKERCIFRNSIATFAENKYYRIIHLYDAPLPIIHVTDGVITILAKENGQKYDVSVLRDGKDVQAYEQRWKMTDLGQWVRVQLQRGAAAHAYVTQRELIMLIGTTYNPAFR